MAVRTISTSIKLDGEQEFKKQMASVNSEMKNLKSEMALATAEFKGQANSMEALTAKGQILRREQEQQAEKVRALERAVADAAEAYGEADSRTDAYKRQLNYARAALADLNGEIQDNDRYLDEARRSADRCADSIDEYGREVRSAGDAAGQMDLISPFSGLDDAVGKLGALKGALAGGAIVGGLSAIAGAITEVVDASEEYRKIMGTLEVSSQAAGYSAEETAQTYERLYSVLGDNQTAATTVANLQAIGLSQDELMLVTDSAIGAWARYGDSIPIDGLAEAINETIRCGEVTGVLADVLNWGSQEGETFGVKMRESTETNKEWNASVEEAKTAEDFFNLALSECSDQSERANLVLQILAKQGLSEAGKAWIDTNADIVAANESQAAFEEAQATLGEKLSPFKDALRDLGTAGFNFLSDSIDKASESIQDLESWWERTRPKLEEGWDKFFGIDPDKKWVRKSDGTYGWVEGSHAGGLWRVPHDGYVAELHRDETVLPAADAAVWRSLSNTGTLAAGTAFAGGQQVQISRPQDIVIHFTEELDGAVLSRKLYRYNQAEGRIHGGSLVEV